MLTNKNRNNEILFYSDPQDFLCPLNKYRSSTYNAFQQVSADDLFHTKMKSILRLTIERREWREGEKEESGYDV